MWTIYGLWCEGCLVDRVRKSIVLVLDWSWSKFSVGVLFASTLPSADDSVLVGHEP